MGLFDTLVQSGKSTLGSIGYALGAPGMGITEPMGTPYNVNQTPYSVFNATNAYSNNIPTSYNATTNPQGFQPSSSYGPNAGPVTSNSVNNTNNNTSTNTNNNSGLDPHINPSTGLWDDNYYASKQKSDTGALFNQISSGWNAYTGQLDQMLGALPGQLSTQQGLAQQSFDTSLNQAGNEKASSDRQLESQQSASLKDLGSNMKNLFQAGNTYLGNRGAGDSSAANQYAYALTQMGSKARAGVMQQVQARSQQIGDMFTSEKNRLQSELTGRMSQLADWFSNAQSQLRQQLGTAGLNKSRDIQALSQNLYNQAIAAKQQLEGEARAQQSALTQWAMNNSTSVEQLKSKLQSLTGANQPFQGIGDPLGRQQQVAAPINFGGALFGKPDENKI